MITSMEDQDLELNLKLKIASFQNRYMKLDILVTPPISQLTDFNFFLFLYYIFQYIISINRDKNLEMFSAQGNKNYNNINTKTAVSNFFFINS